MPAGDQVVYFGRLHGMSRREAQRKARALLDEFGIAERWDERTDALSGGLQRGCSWPPHLFTTLR